MDTVSVTGTALDQETIIRQRQEIVDRIAETEGLIIDNTELFWEMNKEGYFDFELRIYGHSASD